MLLLWGRGQNGPFLGFLVLTYKCTCRPPHLKNGLVLASCVQSHERRFAPVEGLGGFSPTAFCSHGIAGAMILLRKHTCCWDCSEIRNGLGGSVRTPFCPDWIAMQSASLAKCLSLGLLWSKRKGDLSFESYPCWHFIHPRLAALSAVKCKEEALER